ncbi:L-fucose:H+ symporter permease [Flagellimonas myxillae]|uniref:L-fucose:H+ symporter permease n=1 Tax=Flagellimonas myxillae TaxID=2942214 RepID=UPI00201EFFDF|nr:L-fucose:H+ symporter permease [Muricauda myxillae]MCL6265791.1 L-fucose:H+ symporter permease [Muricauda myxillae]
MQKQASGILSNTPILPFILVTVLFFAWGVPNNMTEPLIAAFKDIFTDMSTFQASLVQSAFYGSYFVWAIPAALLVKKTSYKTTLLVGIFLFAAGSFLFFPASIKQQYWFFLTALFTLAAGLSFLETAANPYIIAMGDEATSVRRLNLAQSFNPIGQLTGTFIATNFILKNLADDAEKASMGTQELANLQTQELAILAKPYIYIAIIAAIFFVVFMLNKMPRFQASENESQEDFFAIYRRILKKKRYILSVAALFAAMCAQFGTFAFTIPYLKENYKLDDGSLIGTGDAGDILFYGVIVFAIMRFVCTGLMKVIKPANLLAILAFIATIATTIAVVFPGNFGGYMLVVMCGCAGLLFPTIYGLGLEGLSEEEAKVGASGLIMAIIAIGIMNPIQGLIVDLASVNISYICVAVAFALLVGYGAVINKHFNKAEA